MPSTRLRYPDDLTMSTRNLSDIYGLPQQACYPRVYGQISVVEPECRSTVSSVDWSCETLRIEASQDTCYRGSCSSTVPLWPPLQKARPDPQSARGILPAPFRTRATSLS